MRSLLPLFMTVFATSAPALASEVVPLSGFRSVELRGGGSIAIRPGPVQRVTILEGSSAITRMWVERDGRLRINACDNHCPRHYRLRVDIQSPRIPNVGISGGGSVRAEPGFPAERSLSAAVNGGGQLDLRSVDAVNVSAAVNGGGQVLVRPRATLSAAVNGGGSIRYVGAPRVSMAVHGGGSVSPMR